MAPGTRYALNGDVNIAYQVIGDGPLDLIVVPGFIFDKRGTGLSDPVPGVPTLEERMEDVHAVLDAVGSERSARSLDRPVDHARSRRRHGAVRSVWARSVARSAPTPARNATMHAMSATSQEGPAKSAETGPLEDLVIITGVSGAGKSTAMDVFEDAGYFCVDNLPPEMIRGARRAVPARGLEGASARRSSRTRAAAPTSPQMAAVLDELAVAGVDHRVLFLDASEEAIVTRYKETRRRHPLAPEGSVPQGIDDERELLAPLRERADVVIDSTGLKAQDLRRKLADEMLPRASDDADGADVRELRLQARSRRVTPTSCSTSASCPTRTTCAELRPLTGRDPRVVEYVERDGHLERFYALLLPLLDYLIPQYVAEGKAHLTIAIGCTGGRHRCVAITEFLSRRLQRPRRHRRRPGAPRRRPLTGRCGGARRSAPSFTSLQARGATAASAPR